MSASDETITAQNRSTARLTAVQALYEMDMVGGDADPVLRDFIRDRWKHADDEAGPLAEPDTGLLTEIVRGVTGRKDDLDNMIEPTLSGNWTIERLEVILRAILRAGTFELIGLPETPAKVIINEYVDVSKAFFTGTEPGLVNAVLDRLAQTLRATELEASNGGSDNKTE